MGYALVVSVTIMISMLIAAFAEYQINKKEEKKFNWLGIARVSDNLPNTEEVDKMCNEKADELRNNVQKEFDKFLFENGLENNDGVIIQKTDLKNCDSHHKEQE